MIKRLLWILCVALCLVACHTSPATETEEEQPEAPVVRYEFGLPIDSFRVDTGVVRQGETLGGMLNRLGADRRQMTGITLLPRSEFDVRTIHRARPTMLSINLIRRVSTVCNISSMFPPSASPLCCTSPIRCMWSISKSPLSTNRVLPR